MKIISNNRGIALIVTLMLMTLVLFLSMYFLNSSISEKQISISQNVAEKAYYLAEAGISDMIWKLKNDASYANNFVNNASWTAEFTRNEPFGSGSGAYTVSIVNTGYAHGDIISTGSVDINGKISQRVIKTKVFRAMGSSVVGENAVYADGNIDISSSNIHYHGGGTHSNGNYIVNGSSNVEIEGDLDAVGNYILNWQATADIDGTVHSSNFPPAATEIPMPAVDFNSSATTSMKNRADVTYTEQQFKNLINSTSSTTLDGPIIYVNGDVEIEKNINLTINGLLVIQGDLDLEGKIINLTINHASGTPAGLIVAEKIEFEELKGTINVQGVVYANDQIEFENITNAGANLHIYGGLIARKVTITSTTRTVNIYYNEDILADSFISTEFSPVITVEHWEEEY